ncbi:YbaK/EbsC family protein [Sporolactobacillus sp. THM19-2]|uniref:YbaK/EbsC family protein n=1 Tax=Sporolactobacillus sp. THM19-2 TaxID=2511171 RepID=UPI0010211A3E|nr:YbaK/EbsC family protein [Sporolactobacillus sp. THM19-2]RYL92634.1 YbaK/EbsC family protein [Sporolactobacillus sp. THM19-2]
MSLEDVKAYFRPFNRDKDIIELQLSSATVDLAAEHLHVEPERIAKTLAFRGENKEGAMLVVTAGDARIDNKKFRKTFGFKAHMLSADETLDLVGHAIGGVCPFAVKHDWPVYMDESLKRFKTVFPACGSSNSAIELTIDELYSYGKGKAWVDVCKDWPEVEKEG